MLPFSTICNDEVQPSNLTLITKNNCEANEFFAFFDFKGFRKFVRKHICIKPKRCNFFSIFIVKEDSSKTNSCFHFDTPNILSYSICSYFRRGFSNKDCFSWVGELK